MSVKMFDCTAGSNAFLSTMQETARLSPEIITILTTGTNAIYLETLSRLALDPTLCETILVNFEPIFPDLVARWKPFASSQQIAAILAKILPVADYLSPFAKDFLLAGSPTEETFLSVLGNKTAFGVEYMDDVMSVLTALLRLLTFDHATYLALVKPDHLWALLGHESLAVRYLVVRILGIYLKASDNTLQEMLKAHTRSVKMSGMYEGMEKDYTFFQMYEVERLRKILSALRASRKDLGTDFMPESTRVISSNDLSPLTIDLCGIITPRLRGVPSTQSTLVETSSAIENMRSLATSLKQPHPILLTGPAGSGKTFLVSQLAHVLNTLTTMVSIHIGDQTDAKLLIGTYTTTDTPGSFEWKSGVLTTAVREGRWVLIEDIDKAPAEVLSVLLPLIERSELIIPNRSEKVVTGVGFRLFATMRTSGASKKSEFAIGNMLGARLWHRIDLQMSTLDELRQIIVATCPILKAMASTIMNVFARVQQTYHDPSFIALSKTSTGRQISPRDLFRWCRRVNVLLASAGVTVSTKVYPEGLFDEVFLEAIDCFAGNLQTPGSRAFVIERIAEEMRMSPQRVQLFLNNGHIPQYNETDRIITIGRAKLQRKEETQAMKRRRQLLETKPFATTNHAARLLEQVGVAVRLAEPVLLVGETGTGKTAAVQRLSQLLRRDLTVINLSQQTESGDLLGGYKPIDIRSLAFPLKERFDIIFESTFSMKKNARFLDVLGKTCAKQQWHRVIVLWKEAVKMAEEHFAKATATNRDAVEPTTPKKKRKIDQMARLQQESEWNSFFREVEKFERLSSQVSKSFAFSFLEGSLIKAARKGDWVLLDEINLAAPDTLESIADLLKDGGNGSILLSEKGEVERVQAHPDFRIFACMNPATDVGKRDLPSGLRSRFTELFVASPDTEISNLIAIANEYIGNLCVGDKNTILDIAQLYMEAKRLTEEHRLVDGANQRPHFSVRTLTRTLAYVVEIAPVYGLRRSLYEGFCMSFLTLLDHDSESLLLPIIEKHILGAVKNVRSMVSQIPRRPAQGEYVQFKHYWMHQGPLLVEEQAHYIITPFVERNMLNLVRATATRKSPVLIQGPTSSGKTSMIEYLAKKTGHKFVRINNHEHTDLQEYLGSYQSDIHGQLKFQEGILVEALRNGHWIVLDELNLAPTDVLEALNRLLDDNRELLIPETQEVVRPHRDFMLFATQNPPGLYGGRKMLSRAFRNRFLELHFDDIPEGELREILEKRTQIAPSYCKKIVEVYQELSILRQSSRLFEAKSSFATLRDLFRWAGREAVGYDQLARNGYLLLGERVRKLDEKGAVKSVIEKVMRVKIDESAFYEQLAAESVEYQRAIKNTSGVVWTKAMTRLYLLVAHALRNDEPVLLVGETGCGKTTVCQLLADVLGKKLFTVNAHMNTETGDIIGAQRPVRNRSLYVTQLRESIIDVFKNWAPDNQPFTSDAEMDIIAAYDALGSDIKSLVPAGQRSLIDNYRTKIKALFEWSDGSLVQSMKEGQFFLLDEISLADDSVLERLNSVLESQRTLLLAEKGPNEALVTAAPGFQFFATMNPGGDYGKKELSPALRNRFTEIWVPSMADLDDIFQIVQAKLGESHKRYTKHIVQFADWFGKTYKFSTASTISIRDVLSWANFINTFLSEIEHLGFLQGAALVYIDGLGANPAAVLSISSENLPAEKRKCIEYLSVLLGQDLSPLYSGAVDILSSESTLQVGPFYLPKQYGSAMDVSFNLKAPTTAGNTMRVVRAMQVTKPILLEGSPGVGKTSLVTALAKASGNPLTRINLSEQTDLMDLFGSDIPVEGGNNGEFAWRDAPFLQAMQRGHWVLLDEMNLASQSVLEGLNACLDHRGEAYISELDKTFICHPKFKVYAAQNPHHQGGGRKGLPASFVNRFTVVYVDTLSRDDLFLISAQLFPLIDKIEVGKIIDFIVLLEHEIGRRGSFGVSGSPWEFNLRDILRWLELLAVQSSLPATKDALQYFDLIIRKRFRSASDRHHVDQLFEQIFGIWPKERQYFHTISQKSLQIGHGVLSRSEILDETEYHDLVLAHDQLPVLEAVIDCINRSWPCILVGTSGCGKTSIIRLLASLSGHPIDELAINNDIDTMDIVGGFEQVDVLRKCITIFDQLELWLYKVLLQIVQTGQQPDSAKLELVQILSSPNKSLEQVFKVHDLLLELMDFGNQDRILEKASTNLQELVEESRRASIARFEWFDGMLVRAAEEGRWLVLDNANLCNPSVLDRLNSLLEPNGFLAVNEHSGPDGEPKIVRPHPNFRLFLTMDPRYGELSRAMRNRGIEIFIDGHNANITDEITISSTLTKTSSMFQLQFLKDVVSIPGVDKQLVNIATEYLPSNLHPLVLRFLSNEAPFSTDVTKALNKLTHIKSHRVGRVMENFIRSLSSQLSSSSSYFQAQSFHPLVNQYLLSASDDCELMAVCLSDVYDLAVTNADMKDTVDRVLQSAAVGRRDLLTFLERSAMRKTLATAEKKSGHPLFGFLVVLQNVLNLWLDQLNMGDAKTPALVPLFTKSAALWWDLVNLSSRQNMNESIFHVFLILIEDWLKKVELLLPNEGFQMIKAAFKAFGASLKLVSGFSMERIWNGRHAVVPATLQAWGAYNELQKLTVRFDAVSSTHTGDVKTVLKLKQSLSEALGISLKGDIDVTELLEDLDQTISHFEASASMKELQGSAIFANEFEMILKHQELIETHENQDELALELAHYAGRPTVDMFVDLSLRSLWTGCDRHDNNAPNGLVTSSLASQLLNSKNIIQNQGLGRLPQVQAELSVLSKQLAVNTAHVTQDPLSHLQSFLLKEIKNIVSYHESDYTNEIFSELMSYDLTTDPVDLGGLLNILNATMNEQLLRVIMDSITPALKYCFKPHRTRAEYMLNLGHAWTQFSIACITLYVPSCAFDPAMKPKVGRDRYHKRKFELTTRMEALIAFEKLFTGQEDNLQITLLHKRLAALGDAPADSLIVRPVESDMTSLQGEFTNVLSTCIGQQPIRLLESISNRSTNYKSQEQLFQRNLTQIAVRLDKGFPLYKDLVDTAVDFIYYLKLGLRLAATGASSEESVLPDHLRGCVSKTFLGFTETSSNAHENREKNSSLALHFLWELSCRRSIDGLGLIEPQAISLLEDILQTFLNGWREEIEKEKAEAEANSSLYVFRGLEEDEDEEKEMAEMFPDYENEVVDDAPKPKKGHYQSIVGNIADFYFAFFSMSPTVDGLDLDSHLVRAVNLASTSLSDHIVVGPAGFETILPIHFLSLKSSMDWLKSGGSTLGTKSYDFYIDKNVEEAQRLVKIATSIKRRIQFLLDAWPENVTLQDAMEATQQALDFPNTTPVAKLITKVEKLHSILYEWQGVASKEFSAAEHYDSLTQLIVSWRRLELSTWPKLFDLENEKCRVETASWWYYGYESAISNSLMLLSEDLDLSEHCQSLVAIFGAFLKSSTAGQYPYRLDILKTFKSHAELLTPRHEQMGHVAQAISNVISFYNQYRDTFRDMVAQKSKKLEKDIKDVVLLASWKDTNIVALRESAKRSHFKLFKTARKYRKVLGLPVAGVIDTGLPEGLATLFPDDLPPFRIVEILGDHQKPFAICQTSISTFEDRSKRLIEIPSTVKAMQRMSKSPDSVITSSQRIAEFSRFLVSAIKELQAETPGFLTEENKEAVKHLKNRKQKALSDALKELKMMGLRSNPSRALLEKQATPEKIIATMPGVSTPLPSVLGSIDRYFFRILDGLVRARLVASQHNPDVSSADVVRGLGYFEHMLSVGIAQRQKLSDCLLALDDLQNTLNTYQPLCDVELPQPDLYTLEFATILTTTQTRRAITWLPKVLDICLSVVKIHGDFAGQQTSDASKVLQTWKTEAVKLSDRFKGAKSIRPDVTDHKHWILLEDSNAFLAQLREEITQFRIHYPRVAFITQQISPWLFDLQSGAEPYTNGINEASTITQLDALLQDTCNSILVALQKLYQAHLTFAEESVEDPGWLLKCQASFLSSLKALHISAINGKIIAVMDLVAKSHTLTTDSLPVRALCTFVYPLFFEYAKICNEEITHFARFHRGLCKTTYIISQSIITLGSKGFCSPQEQSHEKGGEAKAEDGTGLGEGEGMEDISKDIEADEDLSELAQEKSEEKEDKKDIQNDKDAVDMDDMEGDLDDASDQGDKEDEDGEEDENELDEETGDVDDLDPNAVDEKLWDEKGDENDKEQEGGETDGGKKDDMEAKGEEGEEEKKNEKDSKKTEGDDEAEAEDVAADEDDAVGPKESETMDQHVPEVDTLELPEDLKLDGDETDEEDGGDRDLDDLEDDRMSEGEGDEGDGKEEDSKTEEFPEKGQEEDTEGGKEEEVEDEGKDEIMAELSEGEEGDKGEEDIMEEDEDLVADEMMDDKLQTRTENALENADDTIPNETQGADGNNDDQTDDNTAAAQQDSGEQKEGKDSLAGMGQADAQNNEQSQRQSMPAPSEKQPNEQTRQDENLEQAEMFRKLGDPLERFHKRNKEILDAHEEHVEDDKNIADNMGLDQTDFEHVQNEDQKEDTQALGGATEDQARNLDDSMAIDSGVQDTETYKDEDTHENLVEEDPDHAMGDAEAENPDDIQDQIEGLKNVNENEKSTGATIGKPRDSLFPREDNAERTVEDEEDMGDDIEVATDLDALTIDQEAELGRPYAEARELWQHYEGATRTLSMGLTEQLRLILEPTLATKMRGDFRTGKRLNMKRIIPYIASQYKKDKIWMRRTKPSKRQYQVMIALDDSKSMSESKSVSLAFETVALVARALTQLEVGQISIVSFGESTKLVHPFDQPFTSDAGVNVFSQFGFQQTKTNVKTLVENSLSIFEAARTSASNGDLWQLEIIISDGFCEDHENIRRLVRRAQEEKVMIVFVIVDALHDVGKPGQAGSTTSILDIKKAVFTKGEDGIPGELKMERYLDTFPFGFYLTVREIEELPGVLATALRQWLSEIVEATVG